MDSFATYAYSCHICPREFFIVFSLKNNKKNSSGQMRQLYAYVANESTQNNIIYMHVLHRSSSCFTVCNEKWYICFKGMCHYIFLSATDPKARATVSIPWLKKFCVNVSILNCILKLFMLITIFKMAALDNNYQNCSWFCSFCSWNIIGIIKFSFQRQGKRILQVVLLSKDTIFKMSSPIWMLFLHYQEQ